MCVGGGDVYITSPTETYFHECPGMERVLVVPSQNDGVHCALGTFSAGETSCSPPQIFALIHF